MGLLGSLFGRKHKTEASSSGQMLVSKMLAQMEQNEFQTRTCEYPGCGRTCMVPSVRLRLITPTVESWELDVGGYCPNHRRFQCHRHLAFRPDPEDDSQIAFFITCSSCGSAVGGGS